MSFNRKLDSSPEYLRLILDRISYGIVGCDNNFNITFRNFHALKHHGISEDINPDRWPEFMTVFNADGVTPVPYEQLPLVKALRGERVIDELYLLKRKNLPDILIKYNASPLFDNSGTQIGALLTSEDSDDLALSMARFKAIFDQSPLSIQIVNKEGKTLLVNKSFQNLWSLTDEFVKNYILKDYKILEDPLLKKSGHLDYIKRAFQGEALTLSPLYYDPAVVGMPGRARWASAIMYPLIDSSGDVREVVIIHQDVTEQQMDKQDREKFSAQLEAIIKQMPAGLMVVNSRGEIPYFNEKMKQMLGDSNRAKDVFMVELQKSIMGQEVRGAEVHSRQKDGAEHVFKVSSGPIFESDGKIKSSVVIASDVTKEKRDLANQGLINQLKSFLLSTLEPEQIVEKIAAASIPYFADACMVDLVEGDTVRKLVTKHRYPHIENIMVEMATHYPPKPGSPVPTIRVIESGKAELFKKVDLETLKMRTVDEKLMEYVVALGSRSHITVPIFMKGETIGAISFIITTPDRPLFDEVDLEVAQNIAYYASLAIENGRLYKDARSGVQLRDDFISIASHELKTPITSLKLQIEVLNSLVQTLGESEGVRIMQKFLGSTNNQLRRLTRLIDDMLDISRIGIGKLSLNYKTVNLNNLSSEVLERFSDQFKDSNVEVKLIAEKDVVVQCDVDRIDQVITNFLTNALRYGGKKPIHIILEETDSYGIIKVRDFGRGIYKEDQERIFKRFERAHTPDDVSGLGLGLYINSQIVEEHKGKISLESEPGKGSVFIVEIPKLRG